MTWVKLDDAFPSHPKIDGISDGAFRLHVTALCWSCQWLTDGFVPAERLRALPGYRYKASHVAELVAPRPPDGRATWLEVEGGYQIHDFLVYQMPAAKVRADRAAAAERMRKRRTPAEHAAHVRANTERTDAERSAELREKFGDPDPYPYPSLPDVVTPSLETRLEAPETEGGSGYAKHPNPDDLDRIDATLRRVCPPGRERLFGKPRDAMEAVLANGADPDLIVRAIEDGEPGEGAVIRWQRAQAALNADHLPPLVDDYPYRGNGDPVWMNDPEPDLEAIANARAEARAVVEAKGRT